MSFRATGISHAILGAVFSIVWCCRAHAVDFIQSYPADAPIQVDGIATIQEWGTTPSYQSPGTDHYFRHTASTIYVLQDFTGDTTNNEDGISGPLFDNDGNGTVSAVDYYYGSCSHVQPPANNYSPVLSLWHGISFNSHSGLCYCYSTGECWSKYPTAGTLTAGFGNSHNVPYAHRFFEIAIPRSELGGTPSSIGINLAGIGGRFVPLRFIRPSFTVAYDPTIPGEVTDKILIGASCETATHNAAAACDPDTATAQKMKNEAFAHFAQSEAILEGARNLRVPGRPLSTNQKTTLALTERALDTFKDSAPQTSDEVNDFYVAAKGVLSLIRGLGTAVGDFYNWSARSIVGGVNNLQRAQYQRLYGDPPRADYAVVSTPVQYSEGFGFAADHGEEYAIIDDAFNAYLSGVSNWYLAVTTLERLQGAIIAGDQNGIASQSQALAILMSVSDANFAEAALRFGAISASRLGLAYEEGAFEEVQDILRQEGIGQETREALHSLGMTETEIDSAVTDILEVDPSAIPVVTPKDLLLEASFSAGATIFDDLRDAAAIARPRLVNISTRLRVDTGDNVLIGGFILTGAQPKKVIVRGIGTSLPFVDKLANPTLELRDSSGALLDSNDNWQESPNRQAIIDTTIPPTDDLESAIVATLAANNSAYTAIVRGVDGGTGIGVVEAYDLDTSVDSKLANISTRGFVSTGDNVLIVGTIVVGGTPQSILVRAIAPSLNVPGKMSDPTLELRDGNGGLIEANDNWQDSPNKQAIIDTTIPPTNDLESAIVATLPANNASYTAIVRGVNGTTGIAVVEVYALP